MVCCDGREEIIWNFINYNGLYEINQNQLLVTTDDAKLFLERVYTEN